MDPNQKKPNQEPCCRCGQPIDLLKDSWQMGGSSKEIRHASCPISPEMKAIPAAAREDVSRPQFLTILQVAKMLSVSDKTIQRRIRSGELPARRLKGTAGGGRETILIDQADVLALLEPYTGNEVAA